MLLIAIGAAGILAVIGAIALVQPSMIGIGTPTEGVSETTTTTIAITTTTTTLPGMEETTTLPGGGFVPVPS